MKAFGCAGNTIKLISGRYLDLADPRPDQFTFGDIAGGLSKICRFGGQCEWFYSVAEHCYHCAAVAINDDMTPLQQAAVLMHDAAEAFLGDVVKPLKIMLPEYERIEHRMELVIGDKFGIDIADHRQAVKHIDRAMLIAERNGMFGIDNVVWSGEESVRPLYVRFELWEPQQAAAKFQAMARMIGVNTAI